MAHVKDESCVTSPVLSEAPKQKTSQSQVQYPKWFGGSASVLAVIFSHPLDLIKVRHQTAASSRESIYATMSQILRNEGVVGMYRGLSASMLRQLTYGSTRFAIYEFLKEQAESEKIDGSLPMMVLLPAATLSGACGALVGNPADVSNVRMQNDRALPTNLRQNYTSIFHVLSRTAREEGIQGLFRGVGLNTIRAGCMTGCQLGSYDLFKDSLKRSFSMDDEAITTQVLASILAGLVATTLCNPVDVVKTRIMSERTAGISPLEIMRTLTKADGFRWMLRGWLPSFSRLGPHTVATLLLMEQHKRLYRKYLEAK